MSSPSCSTPSGNASHDLTAGSIATADPSLADVTERLMAEFGGLIDVSTTSRVVLACRHDLAGTPSGALPELLERLARQRLLQAFPARQDAVTGDRER